MKPDDFEFIVSMLKSKSGLVLGPDKAYLLESRLMPLARKRGFKGIDDLILQIRRRNLPLEKEVVDAMTTNESFFFRDTKPFEHFRKVVLPNLAKTRAQKRSFRIWCAAASSGQEPYSLSMILREEQATFKGWNIDIVGTDISLDILKKARSGAYTQFEVQRGMPANLLIKYFKKDGDSWQLDQGVRSMVQFKEWNLLEDLRSLGQFDVVFCRNVLLYFDQKTKGDVLDRVSRIMPDDGCLYLGGAETVLGISSSFKPIPGHSSVYALTRGNDAACIGASAAGAASAAAAKATPVSPRAAIGTASGTTGGASAGSAFGTTTSSLPPRPGFGASATRPGIGAATTSPRPGAATTPPRPGVATTPSRPGAATSPPRPGAATTTTPPRPSAATTARPGSASAIPARPTATTTSAAPGQKPTSPFDKR